MIDPIAIYNLFGFEGLNIHWYGILICTGIVLGVLVAIRLAKKKGYNSDLVIDLILLALPISIVCARLYYVAFEWEMFADDLGKIFRIWEGGIAIYGAVIGAVIACAIFAKWRKLKIGDILDIGAPALILGQAIGRWGNFVNQEAFGNAVTDPAMQWFPYAVNITKQHTVFDEVSKQWIACSHEWHLATFFYESVWNFLVFGALLYIFKKSKHRGGVFVAYLALYGIGRFFIEGLRTDSLWLIPGVIRVSQMLSLLLVVGGIIYFFVMRNKTDKPYEYKGRYSIGYVKGQKQTVSADAQEEVSEISEVDSQIATEANEDDTALPAKANEDALNTTSEINEDDIQKSDDKEESTTDNV